MSTHNRPSALNRETGAPGNGEHFPTLLWHRIESKATFRKDTSPALVPTRPVVTVTIISENTQEQIRNCLTSLVGAFSTQGPRQRMETHVVDNASKDESVALLRKQFSDDIRLFRSQHHLKYSQLNNVSWRVAHGRYWILLSARTQIFPGAIEKLVQFMDEHPEAGMATAKILNPDGSPQFCAYPDPSLKIVWFQALGLHRFWTRRKRGRRLLSTHFDHERPVRIGWTQCTGTILRREAVEQCGAFDEHFSTSSADLELCLRLRGAGWKIWFCPDAQIVHYTEQTLFENNGHEDYALEEQEYFEAIARHKGRAYADRLRAAMNIVAWPKRVLRFFKSGQWRRKETWFHA